MTLVGFRLRLRVRRLSGARTHDCTWQIAKKWLSCAGSASAEGLGFRASWLSAAAQLSRDRERERERQ